ncbi:response regulator transcription factor [Kitasatospora sp. RG8]|uniref:response regulator n=1 Tax=Kitasatospora sp. RG8 TaxID=2820815 RepID=UPI001ADED2F3|nr:response regulator transcription factor [Kitasatospora sp. RG8]MBP0454552.1 response regulator transcription factor [Kitasatospora sp. RG8]
MTAPTSSGPTSSGPTSSGPASTSVSASSGPVRVLVADDQALLRGSFKVLIETAPGLVAVAEAGTGEEAVALARRHRPDIILMDIRMPGMDGIAATREICASPDTAGTRVLILTTFDLDEYVFAALRAGAAGFLLKDTSPDALLGAIHTVAEGEALLSPSVTRRLIAEFARLPDARWPFAGALDGVTGREREVLTLIARGLSNAELCEHLHLSPGTVKTHIGRLLAKLDARDRAQLVIAAYESGLVSAPTPSGRASASRAPRSPGRSP